MMKILTQAVSVALTLSFAGAAFAGPQAALPKDLPAYGADEAIPQLNIAKKTLDNGLEVWVLPRDGIPRVDMTLALKDAGFAADGVGANGFATVLAGMLTEGTAKRDSKGIAEAAQGLGGSVGAGAANDGITLYANALASNSDAIAALMAEVARSPSFPEDEVNLAKANALQALKVSEAQPNSRATRALLEAVYGDHPYARSMPTEASINSVTVAALQSEHARRFRPDHGLLVITGKLTPEQGFALASKHFGDWKNVGDGVAKVAEAPMTMPVQKSILQRDGSVQSAILMGYPSINAASAEYVPMMLASTVLGGGFSSRVNQNLREAKGYTYGASANLGSFRYGGRVQAGAQVRNEVTGASVKEFFNEFNRLANEPVPAQELIDTKRYVAGGYLISNQMQASVARLLSHYWLTGQSAEAFADYVPQIRAVTADQVQAMARKYWDPSKMSIIVVGDSAAVGPQLKEFGDFVTK